MLLRLQGIISTIENGTVAIALDDGQVLSVPARDLTPAPKAGDTYTLTVLPEAEARLQTDELARTLLSQLITNVPTQNGPAETPEIGA